MTTVLDGHVLQFTRWEGLNVSAPPPREYQKKPDLSWAISKLLFLLFLYVSAPCNLYWFSYESDTYEKQYMNNHVRNSILRSFQGPEGPQGPQGLQGQTGPKVL